MTDNTSADELLDSILGCLGVVDRKAGHRPGQIATVQQLITSYTKQRELALLERLERSIDDGKRSHSMAVIRSAIQEEKEQL